MTRANRAISVPNSITAKPDKSWENDISAIDSFGILQIKIANQFRHDENDLVKDYKEEFFDIKSELRRVYSEAVGRMGLPMTEDRIERAVERASQIILEEVQGITAETAITSTSNKASAPLRPAELWANRPNKRGESPSAWIQRVYAAELQRGDFTRTQLAQIDPPLAAAYATWINRHPADNLGIPTQKYLRRIYDAAEPLPRAPVVGIDRLTTAERDQMRTYKAMKARQYRARQKSESPT